MLSKNENVYPETDETPINIKIEEEFFHDSDEIGMVGAEKNKIEEENFVESLTAEIKVEEDSLPRIKDETTFEIKIEDEEIHTPEPKAEEVKLEILKEDLPGNSSDSSSVVNNAEKLMQTNNNATENVVNDVCHCFRHLHSGNSIEIHKILSFEIC